MEPHLSRFPATAAALQGSSQTVRCGGGSAAHYVTLCGLGPRDKLKVVAGAAAGKGSFCSSNCAARFVVGTCMKQCQPTRSSERFQCHDGT